MAMLSTQKDYDKKNSKCKKKVFDLTWSFQITQYHNNHVADEQVLFMWLSDEDAATKIAPEALTVVRDS